MAKGRRMPPSGKKRAASADLVGRSADRPQGDSFVITLTHQKPRKVRVTDIFQKANRYVGMGKRFCRPHCARVSILIFCPSNRHTTDVWFARVSGPRLRF